MINQDLPPFTIYNLTRTERMALPRALKILSYVSVLVSLSLLIILLGFSVALSVTPPDITSILPNSVNKGTNVPFTLTGSGFQSGFTAQIINEFGDPPWDITDRQYISSTQVKVTVFVGEGTTTGTQKIKIVNPDGQSDEINFTAVGVTSPPDITSILPNSVNKGTNVPFTLTGSGFQSGFTAQIINEFGDPPWDITDRQYISSTQVKVTVFVGEGTTTGTQKIKIVNPDGQSDEINFTAVGVTSPPDITSILPNSVNKGTDVPFTLTGSGFQSGFTAQIINEFGDPPWDITDRQYISSTQVKVTVFVGEGTTTGTQKIKIVNPDGQSDEINFTAVGVTSPPDITSILPNSVNKGTNVPFTLTGSGFQSGFTAQIINEFGDPPWDITDRQYISSTQVKVTVFVGEGTTTGTQKIKIVNPDGQSDEINFTAVGVTSPPDITSILPNSVNKGTNVPFTLTGSGFQSGFTAQIINEFGDPPWDITDRQYISSTQVKVTVFVGEGTTTGTQKIKIVNPDGQSDEINFTAVGVTSPPDITSILPNSVNKGTNVPFTLTGSGFQSGFTAQIINEFGDPPWDITDRQYISSTQVKVTVFVGEGTTTGTQKIKIVNPDGQSDEINFTAVGVTSPPDITSILPNSVNKGTDVPFTLTGSGFQSGFTAQIINEFGDPPWDITDRQYISSTQVKVTVFVGEGTTTGTQKIKIVNPDGQSDEINFTAVGVTSPPDITGQSLGTTTANPGETITFNYEINNPNSFNVDVTLGAQIRPSGSSAWIDDWNNDKNVSLSPGTHNYSRQYQIPPNGHIPGPASSGTYDVSWVIFEPDNPPNRHDTATQSQGLHIESRIAFLDNGIVRVEVDLNQGGAITEISHQGYNLVDTNDAGRLIQVSLWDGSDSTWNPIQTGSISGQNNPVLEYYTESNLIYTKTQLIDWYTGELRDVYLEQWVELMDQISGYDVSTVVKVRHKITYTGNDYHASWDQEFPCAYLDSSLSRVIWYEGDHPWANDGVNIYNVPQDQSNFEFYPTEYWASFVNDQDFGLTLYSHDHTSKWAANRFTINTQPSYLATVDQFSIKPGTVEEATEYFIVGDYPDAREIVYLLNPCPTSGQVTLAGSGLESVTMTLSGSASGSTSTAQDGTYYFPNLPDGPYTLTPSLDGYTFSPASIDITISGSDVSGQDFRACDTSAPLSGVLRDATTNTPLSNITVTADGVYSDVTDENGYYSISGLSCGEHRIEVEIPDEYSSYVRTMDTSKNPIWDIFLTKPKTVHGGETNSGYGPDPVNTATGNYIYNKKDLEIPGTELSFVFNRHYNSQSGQDGSLGFGWKHTYAATLTVNADSSVTIQWGDGKTETWTPDGSGGFTPQYGVFDVLIDNGDGTYTVKKRDLIRYNFDASGMLLSVVDKSGNTISMTYEGNDLVQITDTVGRNINLTHDVNGRITQIADPIGRTIQFAYDGNGDLVSSTDMNENTTTYTYDASHQVLTVVDPRGNTVVTNIYDDQKRVVISQRDAKGGETTYVYDELNNKTAITDPMDNTYYHYHDELLRLIEEEDALGNSAYYSYDSAGNRTEVVDKNGNTIAYTYDINGNVLTKTDALGKETTITYDVNNNPLTRTDALSNTTTYEYNANGNLSKTTDPLDNLTTMTYNAQGQPLTITDAKGNTTTNSYDAESNLIEVTDALGNKRTYTYDGVGRRLTLTNALGKNTAYTYDNNNSLLTVIDPLGNVTAHAYDQNSNRLTTTDPMGNTTTYAYDVKDLLTTTTDPMANCVTNAYDGLDRKTSITDKRGNTATFSYDAVGNLLKTTDPLGNSFTYTYDANGNQLTKTNPLGHTVTYAYDALDRKTLVTDPLGNSTTTTYDALGNITATTNAKGQTTSFEYDAMGRLTRITDDKGGTVVYTYDENGNRLTMTDPNGNTTTFSYDAVGNLLRATDPLGNSFTYTYDANGNKLTKTNPLGNTTSYAYDSLDRKTLVTDSLGNSTTTTYDAVGRVTSKTNAKGQTTNLEYDALGRLTKVIDDKGGTVVYTYDENGNRLTMTDPNGNTTTYAYDVLNRVVQKMEALANTHQYAYDAVGNKTSLTDANGNTISYAYDANNRLTEIKYPDNSKVTFSYDANGNKIQMVDNLGTTSYAYDVLNRMTSYTDPFGKTVTYGYDANGNRTLLTYPDGKIVSYTYDAMNRLTTVTDWLARETIYTYDAAGNLIGALNPNNTKVSYAYDAAERLRELSNTKSDSSVISSYTYTLDAIGNHTNVVQNEPLVPILSNQNIAYTHDAENRLTAAGGTIYTYDTNGNLTGKGSDTLTYDFEDRLVQSNIGGTVTQYSYDGLGNRLGKTVDATTTRYVLDINGTLSNLLAEIDNTGAITAYYVYGLGLISKVLPGGTNYYYHYDSRGSTIALTDEIQNTTDAYAYDSFGNVMNSDGSSENPFKYVGRYGVMEEGNGLSYIRARYYAPEVGRFITKDPQTGDARDGQSLNRYVYALNNPVILIDISGFSAQEGGVQFNKSGSSDENHDSLIQMSDSSMQMSDSSMQISEPSFATAGSTPKFIQGPILKIPTYGNYGGPGHSGETDKKPIDQMDWMFAGHDFAYDELGWGNPYADWNLVKDLIYLKSDPTAWDSPYRNSCKAKVWRYGAIGFFSIKMGYQLTIGKEGRKLHRESASRIIQESIQKSGEWLGNKLFKWGIYP